jgi:GT2 family glycosyltransferase
LPTCPQISVVVISLNEGPQLRRTVERLQATLPADSEIIVVDDGSQDGSIDLLPSGDRRICVTPTEQIGVAKARNWGARHSLGQILVFSDAHIDPPSGWWQPMAEALASPTVGAVGPVLIDTAERDCKGYGMRFTGPNLEVEWLDLQETTPYPVPLLPGGFWAMRRDTFERTGGFDEGMIRWGVEDLEFSVRLWLLGYELRLVPQVEVAHCFRENGAYSVDWAWILHNRLRLALLHFDQPRVSCVVNALRLAPSFGDAFALTLDSDASHRRAQLAARRRRDDNWFFEKFGPAFSTCPT